MVAGVGGRPGPNAPRAVVEELRAGRNCVTVRPQPTVVNTVLVIVIKLKPEDVLTQNPVFCQVNTI